MSYLLVPGVAGAAFVPVSAFVPELSWLQPANMPTRHNSAIKANNLFITGVPFTKMQSETSTN